MLGVRPFTDTNPFSVWREYSAVFEKVGLEDDVRVVVLASGLDKLFTAGLDCKSASYLILRRRLNGNEIIVNSGLSAIPATPVDVARAAFHIGHHVKDFQHAIAAPERCPFPVIAATHGLALGLAIDIITACDVRYAASDTSFSIKVCPDSCIDPGTENDFRLGSRCRIGRGHRYSSASSETHG